MFKIGQITSDARQKHTFILQSGEKFTISIYYITRQRGWFIDELTYGDIIIRGVRITNGPNILRQWKNLLPFGLACMTTAYREPTLLEDFSSGASALYVLSEEELEMFEEQLRG